MDATAYVRLTLELSQQLIANQWSKMAELLHVPPGPLEHFKSAKDLFKWMENHPDPNDAHKRPYLSAQRLEKLRDLLADPLVGGASAIAILEKYYNENTQTPMLHWVTVDASPSNTATGAVRLNTLSQGGSNLDTRNINQPKLQVSSVVGAIHPTQPTTQQAVPRDATPQTAASRVVETLDQYVTEKRLVDLHTHLLGMGDSKFWIDHIIKKYLSSVAEKKPVEFYPKRKLTHENWHQIAPEPLPDDFINELSHDSFHGDFDIGNFTSEVVYSLETWCKCFSIPYGKEIHQSQRHNLAGAVQAAINDPKISATDNRHFVDLCATYAVYNARELKMELRYGIRNTDLVVLIEIPSFESDWPHASRWSPPMVASPATTTRQKCSADISLQSSIRDDMP